MIRPRQGSGVRWSRAPRIQHKARDPRWVRWTLESQATFYVEVEDLDKVLAKAEKLGGKTVMPVTDIPGMNLKFAYFTDPEGHVIGISKGMAQAASQ